MRMTFAEWQQSRGITPWTTVHGFSEYDHQRWVLKVRAAASMRRIGDRLLGAFTRMGDALADVTRSFEAMAAAITAGGSE